MFDHDTQARFWSLVEQRGPNECWPWKAGMNGVGYGVFYPSPRNGVLATRYACSIPAREIPPRSIYCLHSCDNPICCNPRHLRWGTPTDNVRDAISRKRHRNPPPSKGNPNPPKGAAVWNQTLTEPEVREIWRLHLSGRNATQISEAVGHPVHVVADACRGRSWRHLPDAPTLAQLKAGGVRRDKLTPQDIEAIKALLAGGATVKSVAARFGVSTAPISNIKNHGTTWVPKS